MSKVNFCSEDNELKGFMPSEETIEQWLEKLRSNGVKEGSPVRLIGGCNAGKIVPFTFDREKLKVNDCGIGPSDYLGWFFRVSDEACVYPIYEIHSSGFEDVNSKTCAIGLRAKDRNYILTYDIQGLPFDRVEEVPTLTTPIDALAGCERWAVKNLTVDQLYHFHNLNDFWAWLEQNY